MIWRISLFLIWLSGPAWAADCEDVRFDGRSFTHCSIDLSADTMRLFLYQDDGVPYGSFGRLPSNVRLAMNAGMYHSDRRPVGHYVEDGQQIMRVIPNAGPGNFGMLPNGVLCIRAGWARVFETLTFVEQSPDCQHATQSGPMLVIDGNLHPRFIPNSTFTNIRNGVGTSDDGKTAHWVISNQPVSFDHLARFFRDHLAVNSALYLDGRVSRLFDREGGRSDFGAMMGPIIAVTD